MPRQNARFALVLKQIEDRDTGHLGAGAAGRRARDMRLQRTRNGLALTDRRVHVGKKIVGVRSVKIRRFGRVHHRAAADRDEAIEVAFLGEFRRRLERTIRRLDWHFQ